MNFLKTFIAVILGCLVLQSFLPWWTLALACAVAGFSFSRSGSTAFLAGLSGTGLLWLTLALWIDFYTRSPLSDRVARLFPGQSLAVLYLVTALIGGLAGGVAALTGYYIRKVI